MAASSSPNAAIRRSSGDSAAARAWLEQSRLLLLRRHMCGAGPQRGVPEPRVPPLANAPRAARADSASDSWKRPSRNAISAAMSCTVGSRLRGIGDPTAERRSATRGQQIVEAASSSLSSTSSAEKRWMSSKASSQSSCSIRFSTARATMRPTALGLSCVSFRSRNARKQRVHVQAPSFVSVRKPASAPARIDPLRLVGTEQIERQRVGPRCHRRANSQRTRLMPTIDAVVDLVGEEAVEMWRRA